MKSMDMTATAAAPGMATAMMIVLLSLPA